MYKLTLLNPFLCPAILFIKFLYMCKFHHGVSLLVLATQTNTNQFHFFTLNLYIVKSLYVCKPYDKSYFLHNFKRIPDITSAVNSGLNSSVKLIVLKC